MPFISTSPSDGRRERRLPYERAGEVTRKKNAGVTEETEEQPPPFTQPKIGGAKGILQQNTEIADSSLTGPGLNFRNTGGIRAENFGGDTEQTVYKYHPGCSLHLLNTQQGWRRFWSAVMVAQVISWNESVFISEFCKRCYESGKYCRSCDWNGPDRISLDTVSSGRSFEIVSCDNCKSAYGISANCQRLIAYQAHLLEDTSPDRIPEYIPRTLAQKRLAAVGTDRDILPTATVIRHKRPEASQKVDKPSSYALLCVLFYSVSCSTLCLVLTTPRNFQSR
jgi:hypothetical protein